MTAVTQHATPLHRPRLDVVHSPAGASDLLVLAHGGQETSLEDPHDRRPPLLRMWPLAAAARDAAPAAAVGLMRYRYRGWNGAEAHAMTDLRTVLQRLPETVRRIALVGHSMGGRAVLRCADDRRVSGVLALAPWQPDGEPVPDLQGRLVVTAHGDLDRITDPRLTSRYVSRLRGNGVAVAEYVVHGEAHALLHRHGDIEELVRRFTRSCLGPEPDAEIASASSAEPGASPVPLPRWSRSRGRLLAVAGIARSRLRLRPTRA